MIEENWKSMQSTRRRTLKMVRRVSQEQSKFAPASDRWSVGEVLDHLLLADRFYRREISALVKLARSGEATVLTRRMEEIDVSLALIPRGLLPMLEIPLSVLNPFVPKAARDFLTRNRVFAAKNPSDATPRMGRSIAKLRQDLGASLAEFQNLFDANPNLNYGRMIHRHPIMGLNNVPGLLRMAALHELRHQQQIRDVFDHPGFPVA